LGYSKVHIKQGDGYYGWSAYTPYDGIIVTAARDHLPSALTEQLAERGRLVIPIGEPSQPQYLWKFIKLKGKLKVFKPEEVCFVPFTGPGLEQHQVELVISTSKDR